MDDMKTTREVADDLGVNIKTLQLWVREKNVRPFSSGEGRLRRLSWPQEAIEQARRLRDRESRESPLIAAMGPELIAALKEAKRMKDYQGDGDVVAASAHSGRIFREDTPIRDVLRKVKAPFIILAR